jgi:hypothetical protein
MVEFVSERQMGWLPAEFVAGLGGVGALLMLTFRDGEPEMRRERRPST